MSSVIAIVKSVIGQVMATSPEGAQRLLVEGDRVYQGEQIDTGAGGMITLQLADGRFLDLGRDTQWSATQPASEQRGNEQANQPPSAAELQKAITAGVDPTQAFEATAAGADSAGSGGSAGGSRSFVLLDATAERVDPQVGYDTQGLAFNYATGEQFTATPEVNLAPQFIDGNGTPIETLDVTTDEDMALNGSISARDPNGNPITYIVSGNPSSGTLIFNANGTWTYTPNQDYNGSDSFQVTATDSRGASSQLVVNIGITPVNDAPVASPVTPINLLDTAANDSYQPITGQLRATDVDDTNLTWSGSNKGSYGELTVNPDGSYSYVVDAKAVNALVEGEQVSESFVVTVRDPAGASDSKVITINLTGANDTPIASASTAAVTEDQRISGTLPASDADKGAVLTYTVDGKATAGFTLAADGTWSFDASDSAYQSLGQNQTATLTINYLVTDEHGAQAGNTLTVTVTGVNDPATLGSADVQLTETNAPLTTSGTLSISDVDSPATFVAQTNVAGQYGTFSIDAAGNWTYTASSAYNELNVGDKLSESFSVTSADGTETRVSVTINGSNDAPVGAADQVSLDEDTVARGNVLSNDSDVDNSTLSVTRFNVTGAPQLSASAGQTLNLLAGKLTIQANGDYVFEPAANYAGPVPSITYTLSDGSLSATSTLSFSIRPINDAPVNQVPAGQALDEDGSKTFSLLNGNSIAVLDVDGDRLSTTLSVQHGVLNLGPNTQGVTFSGNGSSNITLSGSQVAINLALQGLKYVPDANYNGQDHLTIETTDGTLSDRDSITLTVKPVNDAPTASPSEAQTIEDAPAISGNLIANDVDGDKLTFSLTDAPPPGFNLKADGSWTFDPSDIAYQSLGQGAQQVISIPFSVSDGSLSATSTLTLTITGVNDRPVISTLIDFSTHEDAPRQVLDLLSNASDPDQGDVLRIENLQETSKQDSGGIILSGNTLQIDPAHYTYLSVGEQVELTFTYDVSDGKGGVTSTRATVVIEGRNDAPVVTDKQVTVAEESHGTPLNIAAPTDVDINDTLVISVSGLPSVGTVTLADGTAVSNGQSLTLEQLQGLKYDGPADYLPGDPVGEFSYTVSDGTTQVEGRVTLSVTPLNDAPTAENVSASGSEDPTQRIQVTLAGSDVDGTVNGYRIESVPAHGSLYASASGGVALLAGATVSGPVYFVPDADWNGNTSFQFKAIDDQGALSDNSATASIHIDAVNDAPVATPIIESTNEDASAFFISLLSTASDVEGDRLSVSNLQVTGDARGVVFIPASNNLYVDPSAYNYLGRSESVTLQYSYDINDGNGGVTRNTASLTIAGRNDAPVMEHDGVALKGQALPNHSIPSAINLDGTFVTGANPDVQDAAGTPFVSVHATGDGAADYYAFTVKQGDTRAIFDIDYANEGGFDSVVTLYDANGREIAQNDDNPGRDNGSLSGSDSRLTYTFAQPGTYYIAVTNYSQGIVPAGATYQLQISLPNAVMMSPYGVTERADGSANENTGDLTTTGLIGFSDADLSDRHTTSATLLSATDSKNGVVAGIGTLTPVITSDADGKGVITWTYNVAASALDHLAAGQTVTLVYQVSVSDGAASSSKNVTLTLTGTNDVALIGGVSTGQVNEDASRADGVLSASGTLTIHDVDDGESAFVAGAATAKGNVLGSLSIDADGKWNYTVDNAAVKYLAAGQTRDEQFTVKSVDGTEKTITITITGTNDNPLINTATSTLSGQVTERLDGAADENTGNLNTSGTIRFSDVDLADSHSASFRLVSATDSNTHVSTTALGSFTPTLVEANGSGTVTWNYTVPAASLDYLAAGQTLTQVYEVTVADNKGGSVVQNVTITLVGTNDAPVIASSGNLVTGTLTERVDGSANENVGNLTSSGTIGFSDADRIDSHSVSISLVSAIDSKTGASNTALGTLTSSLSESAGNGSVTWNFSVPAASLDYLSAGQTVTQVYAISISDGNGGTATQNVTITLVGTNDAPVVSSTSITATEQSATLVSLGLSAPTDVDLADTLTIKVSGLPTLGTVLLANGSVVSNGQTLTAIQLTGLQYKAPADYIAGQKVGDFTYTVTDSSGASNATSTGKVTISVTPVNDAPIAVNDGSVITGLQGNYYGYKEGATLDGNNLTDLAGVREFIATHNPNATFTATSLDYGNAISNNLGTSGNLAKFLGSTDAASIKATSQGLGNTSDAIIQLKGEVKLDQGTSYKLKVTADDGYSILIDGKVVAEYNANQSPTARTSDTFTISESGVHSIEIVYWDQGGQAQLKVEISSDGGKTYSVLGGSALAFTNDALVTNEDTNLTIAAKTLLVNDSDADGDPLSIASVSNGVGGTATLVNGNVLFKPDANFNGIASFTYTVKDPSGAVSQPATVQIQVNPVNDAPTSQNNSVSVGSSGKTFAATDFAFADVDTGDSLKAVRIDSLPSGGSLTLNGNAVTVGALIPAASLGNLTFTPTAGSGGDSAFTFSVQDQSSAFSVNSYTMTLKDAVAPTVTGITLSDSALQAGETATVTITFSEKITGFNNNSVTVQNGSLSTLSSADGGKTWTGVFTPSSNVESAQNLIKVIDKSYTDTAGNLGSGASSTNYAIDTKAPTAEITLSQTALKAGETATVTITFSEKVTGFDNTDVNVQNGSLSTLSSADGGKTWTGTFTPASNVENASNSIQLANTYTDLAGNQGSTANASYSIDTKAPTATIVMADTALKVGETSLVTITFSEKVTGFDNSDVTVQNGSLGNLSSADGGKTWTATFTPSANIEHTGNLISITNQSYTDLAGNKGSGASTTYDIDTKAPTAAIAITAISEDTGTPGDFITRDQTLTVSGTVGTLSASEHAQISIDNGATWTNLNVSNGTWNYVDGRTLSLGEHTYQVRVVDDAGNLGNQASQVVTITANHDPLAQNDPGAGLGLSGHYYAYHESGTSTVANDGPNLTSLSQVNTFIANNAPDATFIAKNLSYSLGGGDLGGDKNLQAFLGSDASSLNTDPENSSDAIIRLAGTLQLNAGSYQFAVRADDGYSIAIDGVIVAKFDGIQSPSTNNGSFTIAESGAHSIEIIYWDQGGEAVFQPTLSFNGGTAQSLTAFSPAQENSALVTKEDIPLSISAATLLANDSDADNDQLSITSVGNPTHGTVQLQGSNVLFTPAADYYGPATFSYTISDGHGGTSSATVTINVNAVNDAPVAANDTGAVLEDASLTVSAADGVILGAGKDTDVDGDSLTVSAVRTGPESSATGTTTGTVGSALAGTYGSLNLKADGSYTYVANNANALAKGAVAQDVFTYTVSDGKGGTDTATLTINVTGTNDAPVNSIPMAEQPTNEDTALVFSAAKGNAITVSDVDIGSGSLSVTLAATHGILNLGSVSGVSVTGNGTASVTLSGTQSAINTALNGTSFTPSKNYSGAAAITVTSNDGQATDTDTITLKVNAVADAPTLVTSSQTITGTAASANPLPASTGLTLQYYEHIQALDKNNASNINTVESGVEGTTATRTTTANDVSISSITEDDAYRYTGLVYLEAGHAYTVSGYRDDTLLVKLGGTSVYAVGYNNYGNLSGTTLNVTTSGYYTLEVIAYNGDGVGSLDLNMSVDGKAAVDLNTTNFYLYTGTSGITANGTVIGALVANGDGGYYPAQAAGAEDNYIALGKISATLNDTDGSETLSIVVSAIPAGATLTDGTNSFLSTSSGTSVNVTSWNLNNLKLLPTSDFSGTVNLTVTATATEANGSTASSTATLPITVTPVADAPRLITPDAITVVAAGNSNVASYRTVAMPVLASLGDGSEILTVVVSSLLAGVTLTDGTNSFTATNSVTSKDVSGWNLENLQVTVPAGLDTTDTITVTATSTESNGSSSSVSHDVILNADYTTTSGSGNGNSADNLINVNGTTARDGGGGDDLMIGNAANNTMSGGDGNDVLQGNDGDDILNGDAGDDRLEGGAGNDTLNGGLGNDYLDGGAGNDTLNGGDGNDYLVGGAGNDTLNGGNGNDILIGGSGNDILNGGDGNDILIGGSGNDTLTGGAGNNLFIWKSGDTGSATITDFVVGSSGSNPSNGNGDRIDLSDLLQGENDSNILNYIHVDLASSTLQISTTGTLNTDASNADVTIKLENNGHAIDLSSFGSTSSQIVNSLIAGADPLVKVDHT